MYLFFSILIYKSHAKGFARERWEIISKDFQGVEINTTVSGKTSAPSTMNIKLRGDSMTFEGNEMKRHQPSANGEFIQGGDVPSLTYNSYLNSTFIQNNYGKKADFNFNFDGQYFDGNNLRSMTGPTILGVIPVENSTNVKLTVPFSNEKK